jgi:transposase-like protein/IS1 family transposase
MVASCTHTNLKKHGKDRKGCQRWKCRSCGSTVTKNEHRRPLGDMRIDLDRAVSILNMLLEGMSIRACERITGVKADTICDLVLHVGQNCERFLERTVQNIEAKVIQLDEQWQFVYAKQKTVAANNIAGDVGDSWSWFAIDADTKLILAHTIGKRDDAACSAFLTRLTNATRGRCQVTSDGFSAYTHAVPVAFGSRVDFAQLIKRYKATQEVTRYSPAKIDSIEKVVRFGNPDEALISTSYSERFNLSVRMHVRRFTRLTNAHSKSIDHHAAMVAIFVAYYNFARKHESCGDGKQTPAMVAGLTDHVFTIRELLEKCAV